MLDAGSTAAEIMAPDLGGTELKLSPLLARGPALLAFFKISCPTCQFTFPFLERMASKPGLTILGVSQDEAGPTKEFCREYGIDFPVVLDSKKAGYQASNAYRITHVPSLFLVETDGMISKAVSGFSKEDLTEIGERFHVPPFRAGEQVPAFKPG